MSRPQKEMRIKLTGDDVELFIKAKADVEKTLGMVMTDVEFARAIVKWRINQQ